MSEMSGRLMFTRHEGDLWEIIPVHSLVTPDGQRWDALNGWTGPYSHTADEIEQNQAFARQQEGRSDDPIALTQGELRIICIALAFLARHQRLTDTAKERALALFQRLEALEEKGLFCLTARTK